MSIILINNLNYIIWYTSIIYFLKEVLNSLKDYTNFKNCYNTNKIIASCFWQYSRVYKI